MIDCFTLVSFRSQYNDEESTSENTPATLEKLLPVGLEWCQSEITNTCKIHLTQPPPMCNSTNSTHWRKHEFLPFGF